ncbi:MAG: LysE family translocator [Pseudomonadota bacterium]
MGLDFFITSLIVILIPGTGVVYTVATGMTAGRGPSIAAAFGCTLGILPHIAASALGVAALLHASALLFETLKFLGAAYLLYLAWQTLKDSGPLRFDDETAERASILRLVRTGFLINILNPKLSAFFLAFLPHFVDPAAGGALGQMVMLGLVFMAMTFAVFIVYGAFAAVIRARVLASARAMRWLRRTVALAFAGFGLRLALEGRT